MKQISVIGVALAIAVTLGAQTTGSGAASTQKGVQMREKIKLAEMQLQEFDKNRGVEHLEKAVESLEEVDLLSLATTSERLVARRELMAEWCHALRAIDSIKDPKFDPDDAPELNVMPPFEKGGAVYTPGVDPKSIEDPQVRARYEAARAANEKKKAQRRVQWLVLELDGRVIESAQRLVQKMYTRSAADQKELEAVFAETKLPEARRAQLLEKSAGLGHDPLIVDK